MEDLEFGFGGILDVIINDHLGACSGEASYKKLPVKGVL